MPKRLQEIGSGYMLSKRIIFSFIAYLVTGVAWASGVVDSNSNDTVLHAGIVNLAEGQPPQKVHRVEELSTTQRMALYFIHLLRSNHMRLDKTYLHKFIYYANGLHYAVFNKPLLQGFSFEAHQFGPFVHDILPIYQKEGLFNSATREDTMISDSEKSLCDFTFNALKHYSSGQLSRFTHEEGTPWTRTRRRAKSFCEMIIDPEMDKTYFERPETIRRFFVEPILHAPENFISSSEIAKRLLEGEIITELSKFKLALQENRFDDVRGLVEQLVDLYRRTNQISLNFKNVHGDAFVSSLQTPMEGILSSLLFTEDFINNGELDLVYDESFRTRVAISAGLKNISSLYYLGQIFQTFSNNPNDEADQKAQGVQSRLESLAKQLITKSALTTNDWQESYEQSLAHFYLARYEDAIKWMETALKLVELPTRYRHDLLRRAFYIKKDNKYIDLALENKFWDFNILKATTKKQPEEIFLCFENAIMNCDLPEGYFKAGRMILRRNYTVDPTSQLWTKMRIPHSKDNAQVELGKALLEHSIKEGISEALTFYVESYLPDNDIQAKLIACTLAKGKPFAEYKKGQLLESQHKLQEAREAYLKAGELLGYQDAARLSAIEEEEKLINKRKIFMQKMFESLYEDYTNYVQEE